MNGKQKQQKRLQEHSPTGNPSGNAHDRRKFRRKDKPRKNKEE